ncbi:MAG: hypothetical protein ACLFUN_04665, partial [Desulfobacterales bacterium]
LVIILFAVYILARMIKTWRAGRACRGIIRELEVREAYDSESAVVLQDVQRSLLRAGLRNFRPEGLQMLLLNNVVGITQDGKYYLNKQVLEGRAGGSDV